MITKIILSYFSGYMRICVQGYFVERFINACRQKEIALWKTKKMGSGMFKCNISIRDFKRLKEISRKTKCKVTIKSKNGLPFFFNRYKKRKILAGFLVIFITFMIAISNFVWNIDIECDDSIDKTEIMKILNKNGLEIGKLKKKINTSKIIGSLRYEREDLAWVGIELDGTNAKVKLIKAEKKPEIIKEDEYCNIIAKKEGIITKINVQNGIPVVKIGDLVKKNMVLVNGWLEGKYTGIRYVHAIADVEAKVWYSKKEKIPKKQEISTKTGNEDIKYSIKFNNFEINLFKTLPKFKNYDTIVKTEKVKLFSNIYLPIEIKTETFFETEKQQVVYSVEQIRDVYIPKFQDEIESKIENASKIIDKKVNINEEKDYIDIEVIYEVLENIGTEEKIVF